MKCFFRPKIELASFQDKQLRTNRLKLNLINNTTILHSNAQQFDGTGDTWKQEKSKLHSEQNKKSHHRNTE